MTGPAAAETRATVLDFSELNGWASDDHAAALESFLVTCGDLNDPEWRSVCNLAQTRPAARQFFELFFRPVLIEDGNPGLLTGYFEPELAGSRTRTERFTVPLYRKPPELADGVTWFSRAEIEDGGLLDGRGLEIAWVADPVDAFFLQVQGSGRIKLEDGSVVRLGYAAKNGHEYRSVGMELVRRGIYQRSQVSAPVIASWVRRNGDQGRELLRHNPSYVFFRELPGHDPALGPLGAMNRPLTRLRSIAVDPDFIPLGAPVWVERGGKRGSRHLMIAQDTGAAIKGAQRADIFFGSGPQAGRNAGGVKDPGRLVVLMPIQRAFAMAEGG